MHFDGDTFGDRFGIPHRYADDDELAADPTVDAVYVATPHSRHERDALRFLAAGRAVLCEKPFAPDAAATTRMAAAARDKGVFAMEALWSRFLPSYRILVDLVGSGRIGEPQLVEADFGFAGGIDVPGYSGGGIQDSVERRLVGSKAAGAEPIELDIHATVGHIEVEQP